eukprot:GHVN01105369.1.p2 GENE.GHVN01105369.1~~GHVN01105369.1.p2  ORF type:complete len:113 (+),score=9.93 GHVN01105369.1:35-373(+)
MRFGASRDEEGKDDKPWDFVTVSSGDGTRILFDRSVAVQNEVLANLLKQRSFSEGRSGVVDFPTISGNVLEKLVEYFYHKYYYANATGPVPDFPIADDVVVDLLLVANFLGE